MDIDPAEIDALVGSLRSQLRDATKGLYAEEKWARSIKVQIAIMEEWRSHSLNASELDGPVWNAREMSPSPE